MRKLISLRLIYFETPKPLRYNKYYKPYILRVPSINDLFVSHRFSRNQEYEKINKI